jgi:hypothetical protein
VVTSQAGCRSRPSGGTGDGVTENTLNTRGLGLAYPLPLNTRSRLAGKWDIERWAGRGGFLFSRTRPLIGSPPRHGQRSHVTASVPAGGLGGRPRSSEGGEDGEHAKHRWAGCGLSAPSQHSVLFSGQVGHREVGRKGGVSCLAGPTPLSAPLHVVVVAVPSRASRVVTRAGVNIITWFSQLHSTQYSALSTQRR